ncbi:beta-lactamase/transpeptidase-like protein [Mycena galericulata]|nr:beta-lactamase/transpeptidase-like protein [Mycena galericulata]
MVSVSPALKEKFDRILAEAVESRSTPALFFGITTADGEIYSNQTGTKLVDDSSSGSINEDTVFCLFSQTKLITSIAALKLIEQGKIALDTPVEQVLPELANPVIVTGYDATGMPASTTPATGKITFGQLLNHTSGLGDAVDGMPRTPVNGMHIAYTHRYKPDTDGVSTFFKILKGSLPGIPLKFEPGSDFEYGFSSDCVGFIIERLSGKSLEHYFKEYIFAPLGVTSASFYLTPALRDRLLPLSYRNKQSGRTIERWNAPPPIDQDSANVKVHFGGGGLYSSQKDYLSILRHLLQIKAGTATNPILSLASVNMLFEPTLPPAGEVSMNTLAEFLSRYLGLPKGAAQFSRGLYINTVDVPGARRKGSGAWAGWANTSFFVDPTTGVAVVFATQLAPGFDDECEKLYALLERELYSNLL